MESIAVRVPTITNTAARWDANKYLSQNISPFLYKIIAALQDKIIYEVHKTGTKDMWQRNLCARHSGGGNATQSHTSSCAHDLSTLAKKGRREKLVAQWTHTESDEVTNWKGMPLGWCILLILSEAIQGISLPFLFLGKNSPVVEWKCPFDLVNRSRLRFPFFICQTLFIALFMTLLVAS